MPEIRQAPDRGATPHATCARFLTEGVVPGEKALDVGCGSGDLMADLARAGSIVVGVEIEPELVKACEARGLAVRVGSAEALPFEGGSFDRVVCSVVVPYTDERRAVGEWARVLKEGGHVYASYHGIGYGYRYLVRGPGFRRRFYGLRMLLNSGYYATVGRRLPGFLGDTLCQGTARLGSYYRRHGLVLEREVLAQAWFGLPCLICHRLVKRTRAAGEAG